MTCEFWREAESARIDGEDPGVPDEIIDAHLAQCRDCRDWAAAAARLARRTRVAPAEHVPDLSQDVLRATASLRIQGRPRRETMLRAALAAIACVQLGLAGVLLVPGLVYERGPHHVVFETAAWNVALGVGLLAVATRTHRAGGLLPLLGTLVGAVAVVELLDFAHGELKLATFLPHLLLVVALVLVALLARLPHSPGGTGSTDALAAPGPGPGSDLTEPASRSPRIDGDLPAASRRSAA